MDAEKRRITAIQLAHDWFIGYSNSLSKSGSGPWIPSPEQYKQKINDIDQYIKNGFTLDGPEES